MAPLHKTVNLLTYAESLKDRVVGNVQTVQFIARTKVWMAGFQSCQQMGFGSEEIHRKYL